MELIVRAHFANEKFKPHPKVIVQTDNMGTFSSIPDNVLLIEDVRAYIHCKIGEVCDFKTVASYQKIYGPDGNIKSKYKKIEESGLRCFTYFP